MNRENFDFHHFFNSIKQSDHFQDEVWIHCAVCKKKSVVKRSHETKKVNVSCSPCGFHLESEMEFVQPNGEIIAINLPAHYYFNPIGVLWFSSPFLNETFWAYNFEHLNYLENILETVVLNFEYLQENDLLPKFQELDSLPKFHLQKDTLSDLLNLIRSLKEK